MENLNARFSLVQSLYWFTLLRLDVLPELDAENVIMFRVLPCLVRMCKKEETTPNRIVAAETLAYLIEVREHCLS